jgi:predicted DNA-binding protein
VTDRHKHQNVRLRIADREWLDRYATATGRTLPEVLAEAITRHREHIEETGYPALAELARRFVHRG